MEAQQDETVEVLTAETERVRRALGVASASVSLWESYCFGRGDRVDVSSASLAASLGKDTQAAAPITVRGEVWGSLWVATLPGDRPLSGADLPRLVRAANAIARVLADARTEGGGVGRPVMRAVDRSA